ncbi:hypothetical protein C0J52_02442 [Blattella germanica]|nr:hypothetical protein C0J52_02442 [Blattella germanica]
MLLSSKEGARALVWWKMGEVCDMLLQQSREPTRGIERDLGTYTRRPGSSHRRATSARDDRFLRIHNRCRSKKPPGTSNWSPCKCLDSKEKIPGRWSFSKKTSHGSLA